VKIVVMTMNITGLTHKEFVRSWMRWVWKRTLNLESSSIFPTLPKPVSRLLRSGNRKKDLKNSPNGA
jgi:hypothetical protein